MLEWFRLTVLGRPRSPWLESRDQAVAYAVKHDLASWDQSRREHYLAVPVGIERRVAAERPED